MLYRNEYTGTVHYQPPFTLHGYSKLELKLPFVKYLMLKLWEDRGWEKKIYSWVKKHCKLVKESKYDPRRTINAARS